MRLATLAWRGLLARRLRTGLAAAGIALGVAVVTATIITGASAEQALRAATVELLGRADVRLRAFEDAGFQPRTVQALRATAGVEAVAPVAERRLTVSTAPGENERVFTLLVLGIDPEADAAVRTTSLIAGEPLTVGGDGVLVPASWAARYGLTLGDELLLAGRRPSVGPSPIVGVMRDAGFAALNGGEVIVMTRSALDAAFEVPAPIRYLDVDLAAEPTDAAIARITAGLDEPYVVESQATSAARFASARDAFVATALLFGLVALVVGAFLVGNTLAMTVAERTRELGLLRAAGMTSRQVLGIVAGQAVALGLVGSALGVVVGILLAAVLIGVLTATRSVLLVGLPLPAGGLLVAFVLGLVVTLAGSLLPAARAARISALDALRPSRRPDRGLSDRLRPLILAEVAVVLVAIVGLVVSGADAPLLPVLLALALLVGGALAAAFVVEPLSRLIGRPFEWFFGAQGLLGRANLGRDRSRTGLTVGAMMIALAAVVALGTVAESARAGAERRVASVLPGGNAIRTGMPLEADAFRGTFEATRGARAASPVLERAVVRVSEDRSEEAVIAGIDPNLFEDTGALNISGASRSAAFFALRTGGAALLPEELAHRAGIQVGESVALAVPGAEIHELTVAGLVEHSLPARTAEGAILVSAADARERFGATTASLWIMVPAADVAPAAFSAAVRDTAVQLAAEPLTAADLAAELAGALERLSGLFDVLALIAVVIAALGIVNTLSVGIGERIREIAILRSHGMTVGQVQAMVVAEAAIMGAIAAVLALATGLLVAWALVSGGASPELAAVVRPPWPLLVAVLLLGTGVAALAGLYPARVAASLPIVNNLKHFE